MRAHPKPHYTDVFKDHAIKRVHNVGFNVPARELDAEPRDTKRLD